MRYRVKVGLCVISYITFVQFFVQAFACSDRYQHRQTRHPKLIMRVSNHLKYQSPHVREFDLWKDESWALDPGIKLKESIPLTSALSKLKSKFHWQKIGNRALKSGTLGVVSRILDSFPWGRLDCRVGFFLAKARLRSRHNEIKQLKNHQATYVWSHIA